MEQKLADALTGSPLNKKKVVWLTYLVLGLDNVISQTEMSDTLSRRGAAVYLTAISPDFHHRRKSSPHFIVFPMKFVPVITHFLYTIALLISMPFYVALKRPDYIITHEGTTIVGFVLKLIYPIRPKVILDVRSTPVRTRGASARLDSLLFRSSIILAKEKLDGITILTEPMKRDVCHEFSIDSKFVGVWTSGVSSVLFNPEKYDETEIRRQLNLEDKFVIFYHGAMRHRGLEETLEAVKMLNSERSDLVLFLLGSGNETCSSLRNLVLNAGLENNVIFHDQVDYSSVPKYISMCDLGIVPLPDLPKWRFQCPLKLLEYLAMKKAVIVTDIPANRIVIGKSKCGIFIPSIDPKEIAKAVVFAYSNRKKLKEFGALGRSIIEEKYTWEKVEIDLENFLLSL
jgi:glycosyltransferase involved in cell wall biosynthesis